LPVTIRTACAIALALAAGLALPAATAVGAAADQKAVEKLWESGEEALEAGDIDAAQRSFEKALEIDRNQPRTWNYLGGIRFLRGNYFKALLEFKQAFALDPWDARACNNVGTAYEHLGRYGEAEEFYLRAVEIDERYAAPYRNLGILYARHLQKPDLAQKYWGLFLAIAPEGKEADAVREEMQKLGNASR
jgi:tetratricopeptide (TPR) repeat protein